MDIVFLLISAGMHVGKFLILCNSLLRLQQALIRALYHVVSQSPWLVGYKDYILINKTEQYLRGLHFCIGSQKSGYSCTLPPYRNYYCYGLFDGSEGLSSTENPYHTHHTYRVSLLYEVADELEDLTSG